jgi:hypothetical protein
VHFFWLARHCYPVPVRSKVGLTANYSSRAKLNRLGLVGRGLLSSILSQIGISTAFGTAGLFLRSCESQALPSSVWPLSWLNGCTKTHQPLLSLVAEGNRTVQFREAELQCVTPQWPNPVRFCVRRYNRAAFACGPALRLISVAFMAPDWKGRRQLGRAEATITRGVCSGLDSRFHQLLSGLPTNLPCSVQGCRRRMMVLARPSCPHGPAWLRHARALPPRQTLVWTCPGFVESCELGIRVSGLRAFCSPV